MSFGFFGEAPDPGKMTCAEIVKGYKTNQRLAQERSGTHKKNAEKRVQQLKPFYDRCQEQAAVAPILNQGAEMQNLINQVYDGGAGGGQAGPAAMSATFARTGETFNTKSVLMLAGFAAIGLAVFFVIRKRGPK
jgi:hypothetical protein